MAVLKSSQVDKRRLQIIQKENIIHEGPKEMISFMQEPCLKSPADICSCELAASRFPEPFVKSSQSKDLTVFAGAVWYTFPNHLVKCILTSYHPEIMNCSFFWMLFFYMLHQHINSIRPPEHPPADLATHTSEIVQDVWRDILRDIIMTVASE